MDLPVENGLLATTSEQINGAGIKIWDTKELIAVNISKYKYCVNRSRGKSYDHFSQNLQIKKTGGGFKKGSQVVLFFFIHINKLLSLHVWNDSPLHFNNKKNAQKHHFKCPNLILNYQELLF